MSYRKINVNSKTYEYVVGKSHVKIRGHGVSKVMAKSEVGQPVGVDKHIVTPANIRNVILGRPGPQVFRCSHHDVQTTGLAFDPYSYEIYGSLDLMIDCESCLDIQALEI